MQPHLLITESLSVPRHTLCHPTTPLLHNDRVGQRHAGGVRGTLDGYLVARAV